MENDSATAIDLQCCYTVLTSLPLDDWGFHEDENKERLEPSRISSAVESRQKTMLS